MKFLFSIPHIESPENYLGNKTPTDTSVTSDQCLSFSPHSNISVFLSPLPSLSPFSPFYFSSLPLLPLPLPLHFLLLFPSPLPQPSLSLFQLTTQNPVKQGNPCEIKRTPFPIPNTLFLADLAGHLTNKKTLFCPFGDLIRQLYM